MIMAATVSPALRTAGSRAVWFQIAYATEAPTARRMSCRAVRPNSSVSCTSSCVGSSYTRGMSDPPTPERGAPPQLRAGAPNAEPTRLASTLQRITIAKPMNALKRLPWQHPWSVYSARGHVLEPRQHDKEGGCDDCDGGSSRQQRVEDFDNGANVHGRRILLSGAVCAVTGGCHSATRRQSRQEACRSRRPFCQRSPAHGHGIDTVRERLGRANNELPLAEPVWR